MAAHPDRATCYFGMCTTAIAKSVVSRDSRGVPRNHAAAHNDVPDRVAI